MLAFDERSVKSVREGVRRVNIRRNARCMWVHVNAVVVIDRGNVRVMSVH